MSTHKNIDRICVVAIVFALVITSIFICGESLGIEKMESTSGYEARLFDYSKVHTIDITMDDWDSFIDSCQSEEYTLCNLVIDGESFKNVAIRGKGNTSLSNVSSMNSQRYSFKIEFDHYNSGNTYYGLDKLSLNNIIQDNTYMKDYLTYRLMNEFSVAAPLCSYVNITVAGESWGLYLAVEGVEDGFLSRNYGNDSGELYKPDSMSFGGGRGNGKNFDMDSFSFDDKDNNGDSESVDSTIKGFEGEMPDMNNMPEMPDMSNMPDMDEMPDMSNMPDMSEIFGDGEMPSMDDMKDKGFSMGGMGSNDVKLQYIDDNITSYSNIFDNAKTDVSDKDKERLISSLKSLSAYEDIENVVDIDKVIRYFVVHNYVCNGDSYTGSMVHNYYLYEQDGKLSMIPWDYNLAFGGFQSSSATDTVNSPIDSPVSGGDVDDRPMIGWIFSGEEYTEMYHEYFAEFLQSVDIEGIITQAEKLISPYVEDDPTKFCTYDEYTKAVETLKEFCSLRSESINSQLLGSVPSTESGQKSDSSSLIDASHITISDMGTMNVGGKGDMGGMNKPNAMEKPNVKVEESTTQKAEETTEKTTTEATTQPQQNQGEAFQGGEPPEKPGGEMPQQGGQPDNIGTPPNGDGSMGMPGGNPPNKPEGMGENMGEGINSAAPMEETTTEKAVTTEATTEQESTAQGSEEATTNANKGDRPQGERNDKMPGSTGGAMNGVAYIIGSVLLLAFGLIFACGFKRRKGN